MSPPSLPEPPARARVGVTVVAGFLGSGKTTLLRRIVGDPQVGPRVAVIVNELGALGLDEDLIASERTTPTLHVRQLTSGCVCCTLRGDLFDALQELLRLPGRPPPEHVLIEASGAARASELSYAVNALGFEAPFQTEAVVTLVDARQAARAHREHPVLFEDQVRSADVVLLNKGDLVPDPAERRALLSWLRPLALRATWVWTEQAGISPALLLGTPFGQAGGPAPLVVPALPIMEDQAPGAPPQEAPGHDHGEAPGHDHGGEAHGFTSLTLPVPWPVRREALEDLLEGLADRIFRIKGIVDVAEAGGPAPLLVQAVGDRIDLDLIPAASPLSQGARRLIFIGTELDRAGLEAALSQLR